MIGKMTKYSFILLNEGTDSFIEAIQQLGVVDITRSQKPVDGTSEALLARAEYLSRAAKDAAAVDFSNDPDLAKIIITSHKVSGTDYAEQFNARKAELDELNTRIQATAKECEERRAWGDFDASALRRLALAGCKLHFYSVPASRFDAGWAEQYPLQVISDEGRTVKFVVVSREGEDYTFPVAECAAPEESYKASEELIASLSKEAVDCKIKLLALRTHAEDIEAQRDMTVAELDGYLAKAGASEASEGLLNVFVGYAPVEDDERLTAEFDKMDVLYIKEEAATDDNPPIKLKNNKFVSMFETLTDLYGRPAYDGFDPTPFISIFFLLFFAMCMGDCGYGLVLIGVGFLLKKAKSFAKFAPLVTTLGIGTFIVGFIFHTFFSVDMSQWAFIPDALKKIMVPSKIAGFDGTMVVAIAVGVVHLCLAMVVKTINATKNKGFLGSLGTWGWTLLIVGGVAVGAFALAGVLDSAVTKWAIIVIGCISAVGIFLLNNLHRNPLINIGAGLWETYNTATGLLGDVLSYLRLYALGLAGSMLGFAFNDLAKMALGGGGSGWIPFILIVVVGHTLNIAMAALGAFVHPLRLNFLEFFKNSGYEATGRIYTPLKK